MENLNIDDKNKKMPFNVPEGYFEGFEEKMMARIKAEENAETENAKPAFEKVRALNEKADTHATWRKWTTGVAAAAVVLIGVFAVVNLRNDVSKTGEEIVVAAGGTYDEYYDALNEELNSEEIEEALAQIEFEEQMSEEE